MDLEEHPAARRRRGVELESALLDATWAELVEVGYGALTFDAVAQRAGTSRPVVYRRWATKPELVRAAVARVARRDAIATPDTGSLRGDMVAIMRFANQKRIGFTAFFVAYLGGYFLETGTSPADLREVIIGDRPSTVDIVIDRAIARGEVDAARMTPRVRTVAFDLYRHDALMTLKPLSDATITEIVDSIFLPLATGRFEA
jgi:AcrR family transcriptional regulator